MPGCLVNTVDEFITMESYVGRVLGIGRDAEVVPPRLSERQLECLAWAQEGKSAGDIGQILGLSGRTVEGHLAKACGALGVRTRVQAVVRARTLGLLGAT